MNFKNRCKALKLGTSVYVKFNKKKESNRKMFYAEINSSLSYLQIL